MLDAQVGKDPWPTATAALTTTAASTAAAAAARSRKEGIAASSGAKKCREYCGERQPAAAVRLSVKQEPSRSPILDPEAQATLPEMGCVPWQPFSPPRSASCPPPLFRSRLPNHSATVDKWEGKDWALWHRGGGSGFTMAMMFGFGYILYWSIMCSSV